MSQGNRDPGPGRPIEERRGTEAVPVGTEISTNGVPDSPGAGWAEDLLEAEGPVLLGIGSGRPSIQILETICQTAGSFCPGSAFAFLRIDPEGQNLAWMLAPTLPRNFREILPAIPVGSGADQIAPSSVPGHPIIFEDLRDDRVWSGRVALPSATGLRASFSTLIGSASGGIQGALVAYLRQARRPNQKEFRVARRMAKLAAIALDREAIEMARSKSEKEFRACFDLAAVGAVQVDARTGRFLRVNRKFREITGYDPEKVPNLGFHHLTHSGDRSENAEQLSRFLGGDVESYSAQESFLRKDGELVRVEVMGSLLRDDEGRPHQAIAVIQDVTGRWLAERALRASEEHYRAVFDQAAMGIAEVDLSGRYTRANDRYCEILGYSRRELLGHRFQDITHQDDLSGNLDLFDEIADGKSSYSLDKRYIRKDGSVVWTRMAVSLIRDGASRPAGVVVVAEDITDRVRTLEDLRESEAGAALAFKAARLGRWEWDLANAQFRADARCREVCGFGPDQPPSVGNLLGQIHPEDRSRVEASLRRAIEPEGDGLFEEEFRFVEPDGSVRWVVSNGLAVFEGRGGARRANRMLGTVLDVTDRREAEDRLRASEALFRQLADAMPQIVWMSRPDLTLEYLNERWFRFTGQSVEQAYAPGSWASVIHPDDHARILETSGRDLALGEPFEAEYRIRGADGDYRWHLGRAVNVRDHSGKVVRRFGTATDIDEQKRAEGSARFLAEAGAKLGALVDEAETLREVAQLAVPFFADWCVVDMLGEGGNLRRLVVAHADPSRVELGLEYGRRYPPRPDSPHGVIRVLRTGRSELIPEFTDEMLQAGVADGEHLRLLRELGLRSFLCVPLKGRTETLGAISFVAAESGRRFGPEDLRLAEDLSYRAATAVENARLYEALRQADRRKDEFLATLAHELRNPLAPILNALHLMGQPDTDGKGHEAERLMAQRQVTHLARLVDDLMDVARISRGKIVLKKQSVEIAQLIRHAVDAVRPALEDRRHELVLEESGQPIYLDADPIRLDQVLDNLLTNAIKYTEPGGRITLSTGLEGDQGIIRVRDTGIGIEPSMVSRVFEMFVQAERRSDRSQGGLGIGLGLVKSLVEMHGGTIRATSPGSGLGAEFELRLPATQGTPKVLDRPRPPARETSSSSQPARRRVLVVDDNEDAANSLARLLTRIYRQEVRVAYDGPTALGLASEFLPEIFILDIGMPGMDGHEVARRLRQRPEFAGVLLIALSGWGQDSDRQSSKMAGFDHHLVKPVDLDSIGSLIHRSLTRDRAPTDT